jgi:hypothetical protein
VVPPRPTPSATVADQAAKDPKVPEIDPFNGEREDANSFLTRLQLKFQSQPIRFQHIHSRIQYAVMNLKGKSFY